MTVPAPHFLLHAEAVPHLTTARSSSAPHPGNSTPGTEPLACASGLCDGAHWRFVLTLPSGETSLEAADEEPEATAERLELLAVVRGLEALAQPSRVTLLTGSKYLRCGLSYGLNQWRENDWQWERYGRMTPVKNGDLWQRLDRLLEFHSLDCRPAPLEKADDLAAPARARRAPQIVRNNRVLRIDNSHSAAKQQISNPRSQIYSKSKRQNFRNRVTRGHSKLEHWTLFENWRLMLGHWWERLTKRHGKPLAHRLQRRKEH